MSDSRIFRLRTHTVVATRREIPVRLCISKQPVALGDLAEIEISLNDNPVAQTWIEPEEAQAIIGLPVFTGSHPVAMVLQTNGEDIDASLGVVWTNELPDRDFPLEIITPLADFHLLRILHTHIPALHRQATDIGAEGEQLLRHAINGLLVDDTRDSINRLLA